MPCGIGPSTRLTGGRTTATQDAEAVSRHWASRPARRRGSCSAGSVPARARAGRRDPGSRSGRPPARSSLSLGELMMHAQSFGTAPLDRLVVAVRAAQDRLQRGPEREPNLGNAGCRSCLHGTGLLDQLAAAVRAAQDRLQRGPDREEVHAQSGPPGPPPAGAAAVAPARPPSGGAPFGASTSSPKSTRIMLYTSSLGTVLLDQIAAAVNAARRRFQRVPDQESNSATQGAYAVPRYGAARPARRRGACRAGGK